MVILSLFLWLFGLCMICRWQNDPTNIFLMYLNEPLSYLRFLNIAVLDLEHHLYILQ